MPIYDYECRNCGHRVEVMHGVHAAGPAHCERCGGQMRKLLAPPAIVFKGSGWAKKDFRDASRAKSTSPADDGKSDVAASPPKESGSTSDATSTKSSDAVSGTTDKSKGTSEKAKTAD